MKLFLPALATLLAAFCVPAGACDLPSPKGEVILVVDGMINACNDGMEVHLDKAMIEALPRVDVRTANPWDDGEVTYRGVLLRDLMDYVKADGKVMTVTALNDYRSDIQLQDTRDYDVILADRRNGTELAVRDKGPLFVVFPFLDHPDLKTDARYAQSVWQVNRITLK